jgi:hypothetical protein
MMKPLLRMMLLAVSVLLVAGCSASSMVDLRQNHAGKYVVELKENYQSVYGRFVEKYEECDHGVYIAHIFPDKKKAFIVGDKQGHVFDGVDIEWIDDNTTRVTVYYSAEVFSMWGLLRIKWITEDYPKCHPRDLMTPYPAKPSPSL